MIMSQNKSLKLIKVALSVKKNYQNSIITF